MNPVSPAETLVGMLYAIAVGAALGAFYDVFRVIRLLVGLRLEEKSCPRRRLPLIGEVGGARQRSGFFQSGFVFVCDLLFFAVATAVYTVLIFHAANGQNRWFYSAAAIFGFVAYLFTVGALVMRASGAIRFALIAALSYAAFFLLLPFRAIYKSLLLPLCRQLLKKFNEKRTKKERKALAKTLAMVYNIEEE